VDGYLWRKLLSNQLKTSWAMCCVALNGCAVGCPGEDSVVQKTVVSAEAAHTGEWIRKIHAQLFERHGASEPTTTRVRPFQLKGAGGQSSGGNSEGGRSDVMAKLSRRKTA